MPDPTYYGTNRNSITLPADVSSEILSKTIEDSAIMRLARRINLPGRGVAIPVITADPQASWVAETNAKPVSNPTLATKIMTPYKLAVIVPFSTEFRRDAAALYDELVRRLPAALGSKFDATVLGAVAAPGSNFDTFAACTQQSILTAAYSGLVAADTDIAAHGGMLNGFALGAQGRGLILGAVDGVDRPIFQPSANDGAPARLIGATTYYNRGIYIAADDDDATPAIVGIAGDWSQAMYGTVEGVQVTISDQATLDLGGGSVLNLWQQNMFAVRAEIEIGFRADTNVFNLLTGAEPEDAGGSTGNTGSTGET